MSNLVRGATLGAIKDVILTFEAEHEGKPLVAAYRPAVALIAQSRLGDRPDQAPVITFATYLVDVLVSLTIDGERVPVDRRALHISTAAVMWNGVLAQIIEHASAWATEHSGEDDPIVQRAGRAIARAARRPAQTPARRKAKGKRR